MVYIGTGYDRTWLYEYNNLLIGETWYDIRTYQELMQFKIKTTLSGKQQSFEGMPSNVLWHIKTEYSVD